ncbi:Filamin repeat domain containing protein [Acanthamoeba castellanii str. Neff]|uniref:Filamin repeat domain containing protein n=1 Tax=Acanthamoeba castellanii (strain ATCC 30010 / Neff) TaxID=1257118 RepID=L8HDD6_ACACF|nr:Filamin repeat domain containing protein [Acanthamoeba castellanii str. Neff]ELR22773.1 Filamin repeat domain containing protein [Acanthamoeba castellanii str. Neff]
MRANAHLPRMDLRLSLTLAALLFLFLALAQPCVADRELFKFDFSNTTLLTTVNGARIQGSNLQITTHDPDGSGFFTAAAWYSEPVRGESFRTSFAMRFTNYTFQHNGNQGGMAFVVRVADGKVGVVGPGSGGIGYGDAGQAGVTGLSRSLAVEFDTFKDESLGDPTRNHYQVHTRGNETNSAYQSAAVGAYKNEPFFNDNQQHNVIIEYSQGKLTITVDGALEPMNMPMDLDELFGPISGGVMVGFTGSTQGVGETQEILSWDYVYLGNTEAGKSEAYGPGKEKSVAGQEGEFTIQAVDQFGYNITVGGENFTVTIDPTTPDPLAAPVEVMLKDNGDGTYSVSYRGTTATAYTVHARFQGSDIKESPWTMTIDPADIDPAQCTGSGSFTGGIAGEQLTLEVQAKDTFGNKVGKQFTEATFRAQFSNGLEADFAAEGDEGLYKATYAIDQQGLYSIEVLFVANATTTIPIQGTPLPIIPRCIGRRRLTALQCLRSPWANCTIVPADPEAAECYAQGEGLQFAIAGASGNFSIVPRDRFNNTLHAGLPPSFAFKGAVTGGSADLPVTIQAVAGENGTVTYAGSYTVTTAGAYSLELFLGEAHIAGSPFPLSVIPSNSTWGPECVAYGPGLSGGGVGQTRSFVIQARDPFGNNMTESNATFTVVFTRQQQQQQKQRTGGKEEEEAAAVEYNITRDAADKGKFLVSYRTVVAGQYSIGVSLDDKEIKGSPFAATVLPGALFAQDCVARGSGLTRHEKNVNMKFTIFTVDEFGNSLGKGGALFLVDISDRFTAYTGTGKVEDNGDGTYGVTYSVPKAGHYRLRVTTAGTNIRGSPWFFSIDGESMPETEKNLIIAGSVIGAVLVLAFVVGLVVLYVRKRRSQYTVLA